MKDLSVIIVNYNVKNQVRACIRSILDNTSCIDYEIIVIDNCSIEVGIDEVVREFPEIRFIQNSDNEGFAKANNKAAKLATGRNLLFLNPDTILFNNALHVLVDFLDSRDDVGIVGPRLYKNLAKGYHPLYISFTSPFKIFIWHLPLYHLCSRIYYSYVYDNKRIRGVDWVCGAAVLVKESVWTKLNGFDEAFFMYFEDEDLCLRAKQLGYAVYYNPGAEIIHLGGESAKPIYGKICQYYWESKKLFLRRYCSRSAIRCFKVYFSWLIRLKLLLGINRGYNKLSLDSLYNL